MKVALILPPALKLHDECFLMPPLALPVLAGRLRQAGHEAVFCDYNIFFSSRRGTIPPGKADFRLLEDKKRTLAYISRGKSAEAFRKLERTLLDWQNPGQADLYAVSLNALDVYIGPRDPSIMRRNIFLLNAAALLIHALKRRHPAPAVIGNDNFPKAGYEQILAAYKCFDYAAFSSGEASLLSLCGSLSGGGHDPAALLKNSPGGPATEPFGPAPQPLPKSLADYAGYPLERYGAGPAAVYGRFAPPPNRLARLLRPEKPERQLIVPFQFEDTCRGHCAFCGVAGLPARSANTPDSVFEALCRLKEAGATGVYFINTNFNNTYKFADELCSRMIRSRLGMQWCDCVNFRELDAALLRKMRLAGAVKLTFGLETGSAGLLRLIRKGISRELVRRRLKESSDLGIWNAVELIAGLPHETALDVRETSAFARSLLPYLDSYALSKFRLFDPSPFSRAPDKFGIRLLKRRKSSADFLSSAAAHHFTLPFRETGGLDWRAKCRQASRTERLLHAALRGCGCIFDSPQHAYLLMLLYRRFGHGRKPLIREIFRTLTRTHRPYYS
jgi:radical SAM superfamily enzyme YgiQ (UPF0313 family)